MNRFVFYLSFLVIEFSQYTLPIRSSADSSVIHLKPQVVAGPVTVSRADDPETDGFVFTFHKLGRFKGGKYDGWDFIRAFAVYNGPCKGCGRRQEEALIRYAKKGSRWVCFPKMSAPMIDLTRQGEKPRNVAMDAIDLMKQKVKADDTFAIPVFEYPKVIVGKSKGQTLIYAGEDYGEIDLKILQPVFKDPAMGVFYSTRSEASVSKAFYYSDFKSPETETLPPSLDEADSVQILRANGFYVFRPDGTYLIYRYIPYFLESKEPSAVFYKFRVASKTVSWTDGALLENDEERIEGGYTFQTRAGCEMGDFADYESLVPEDKVKSEDLKVAGTITASGEKVYVPKEKAHFLYNEFYDSYRSNYAGWRSYVRKYRRGDVPGFETEKPYSLEEFVKAKPLFLWRDPFGRWVRFSSRFFQQPDFCEPIIYLYSRKEETIDISLEPKGGVRRSEPEYGKGWKVKADPAGTIVDLSDSRKYPYLFWEGDAPIFRMREEGFVVKSGEVPEFFKETLPRLGLNEREAGDFEKAWVSQLTGEPYFFITFYWGEFMEKIAPLRVSPPPDTSIRILMDFKPLKYFVEVPVLELPPLSPRRGFTLVEWGGLKR